MEGEMKMEGNGHCKKYQSFVERGQRIVMAAELGMARSSGVDRQWSRALCSRLVHDSHCKEPRKEPSEAAAVGDPDLASGSDDGEEEVEVERRVKALQRLVPGGEEMEMDDLFEKTADYIEAMRGQVSVMRALTKFIDGVARETDDGRRVIFLFLIILWL